MISSTAPTQVEDRPRFDVRLILLGLGALIAYAPLLAMHARNLSRQPEYHFAPFVLIAIVGLLWTRWREAAAVTRPLSQTKRIAIWIAASLAWLCLAGATILQSPVMAALSANLAIGCGFLYLSRFRRIPNLCGIWCLLWLLFPLPFGLGEDVIQGLQRASSRASGDLLDLVGVNHLLAGNVVQLPDRRLFVDEACSGIVSVMAVISCGLMFAVWQNRSLIHTLLLVVSGVGWAVVMNVGRIFTIAFAAESMSIDLSTGWQHQVLGLFGFALVFVAVVSTDLILCFLLDPIEAAELWRGEADRNPAILLWNRLIAFANPQSAVSNQPDSPTEAEPVKSRFGTKSAASVAGAFAVLGFCQVSYMDWDLSVNQSVSRALDLSEVALPEQFEQWTRTDFEEVERNPDSIFGQYSRVFSYVHEPTELRMLAAIDFPFSPPWHELCGCYEGSGWTLLKRSIVSLDSSETASTAAAWPCVEGELAMRSGEAGYLVFCFFDERGEAVDPPSDSFWDGVSVRLRRRPGLRPEPIFQVQTFVQSPRPLAETQRAEVRRALAAFRETFRAQVTSIQE